MQIKSYLFDDIKSIKGKYWNYKKPLRSKVEYLKKKYNISTILASILTNKISDE